MKVKETLKKKWTELSPARKKKAVVFAAVLVVLLFGLLAHGYKKPAKPAASDRASAGKTISLDSGILKKSEYMDVQKELSDFKNQLKEQNAAIANSAKARQVLRKKTPDKAQPLIPKYFPPPPGANAYTQDYPPPAREEIKKPVLPPTPQMIGGIDVVSGPPEKAAPETSKKKRGESVYLPPSFMEATLLTGMDAPTSDSAKQGNVPVLLRIKAPAVLPNRVKEDLKGCFVIAAARGDLADERAHVRLVSLSCVARNGAAVIDQPVRGFVVDTDGKVGLRGRVVSKMGSALARSFIAGFFGGLGQATQAETQTTSISALGYTQTIQPSKILEAGAGNGIAQAANQLQQFYLALAKQSIPVIEVGATRDVTLVVEKGVDLHIKNFCNHMGEDDKCGN